MVLVLHVTTESCIIYNFVVNQIFGLSVASFRLSPLDAEIIFGAKFLPIIQDDILLQKLIEKAHVEEVNGLGFIHLTITATCARIKSNKFRVITSNLRSKVSKFVDNCPTCLRESLKTHTFSAVLTFNIQIWRLCNVHT